jgi:hypothetical protein
MNATDRSFTVILDDSDRLMVLTALGFASMHLIAASAPIDMRRPIDALIRKLSSAPGQDSPQPNSGTDAARAVLAPMAQPREPQRGETITYGPAQQDYFAADRKGNISTNPPTGAELAVVPIVSAQEKPSAKGKFLQVIFGMSAAGTGAARTLSGKANCFDVSLWPHIKKAQGHEAQLWIVEKGDYLNIVGVRA